MTKEIWKDIDGYERYYQISNLSRVKSLKRLIHHEKDNRRRMLKEKILKQHTNGMGYYGVKLNKNGHFFGFRIHRLVAKYFIQNPYNKPDVNHKNGIKTDNRIENLEWVTKSENSKHAYKMGFWIPPNIGKKGRFHYLSKPVIQLNKDGSFVAEYGGQNEASRETGIHHGSICYACNGKYKTAGGYVWEFKI